jgi:hypothetical protein
MAIISEEVGEDEMGGACSTNMEERNKRRLLVRKPEGKMLSGKQRRGWVDNIKKDLGHTYLF